MTLERIVFEGKIKWWLDIDNFSVKRRVFREKNRNISGATYQEHSN